MGTVELERAFQSWSRAAQALDDAAERLAVTAARKLVSSSGALGWGWLESSLKDDHRKWFAAEIVSAQTLPRRLFEPFLLAAVHERNPSSNRFLIEPCVRSMGARRVLERLFAYLESGSPAEKAGAASALYWVRVQPGECTELRQRIQQQMLREFVTSRDLEVQRRILPMLELDRTLTASDAVSMVSEVIRIARNHPDDYIRHRVAVQLGEVSDLSPLPTA